MALTPEEAAHLVDEIRRREAELSGYREEAAVAEAQLVAPSAEDHRLTTVEVTWDDVGAAPRPGPRGEPPRGASSSRQTSLSPSGEAARRVGAPAPARAPALHRAPPPSSPGR